MQIKRLFIANRGEIAVRIIRAAQGMGITTIQAYSEADSDMLAVRLADESVCIGPPTAAKSYLDIAAIVQAATQSKADAVHPGYGFLAENASFVRAVEAAGMRFVGPLATRSTAWVTRCLHARQLKPPGFRGSRLQGRLDPVEEPSESLPKSVSREYQGPHRGRGARASPSPQNKKEFPKKGPPKAPVRGPPPPLLGEGGGLFFGGGGNSGPPRENF